MPLLASPSLPQIQPIPPRDTPVRQWPEAPGKKRAFATETRSAMQLSVDDTDALAGKFDLLRKGD